MLNVGGGLINKSMRKIKLEYNLCVFLFAYLHQADLSLHRAGWTGIRELKNFYSNQINPQKVAKFLISNTNINANKLGYYYGIKEYGLNKRKILSLIHFSFRLSPVFLEDEIYYICRKLIDFAEILERKGEVHPLEMEKLRLEISKFLGILMYRISYKDYSEALKIEHYMQHDGLKDIKIKEFIKKLPNSSDLK